MSYLELIGRWLIDMGQQLIPLISGMVHIVVGAAIYRWGRNERGEK